MQKYSLAYIVKEGWCEEQGKSLKTIVKTMLFSLVF